MANPITALVVGGSRGIGLALTRQLAARGDRVIATCREDSKDLTALGVRVEAGVDVTSDASVQALAQRLADQPLDLLVLSAGVLKPDDLDGVRLDDVHAQLEVNAIGPLRVARALRAQLRRGGKIAVLTSRMGSMGDNGSGGYYGYRMSKAALNAMAVSLARDLRLEGVSVAILHPGFVRTEMTGHTGNVTPEQSAKQLLERIDALTPDNSGTFWHASGDVLPW
jgi:NAD(P)-dependent dehydrogenase (short-subunit alcohol dehydrogenase family)